MGPGYRRREARPLFCERRPESGGHNSDGSVPKTTTVESTMVFISLPSQHITLIHSLVILSEAERSRRISDITRTPRSLDKLGMTYTPWLSAFVVRSSLLYGTLVFNFYCSHLSAF